MMHYINPVYRPPSEANSLILQVTNGCSWNRCAFCEMYTDPQKRFSAKTHEQLEAELQDLHRQGLQPQRVFLADGDALTLSIRRLIDILDLVNNYFPNLQRISSYCLPRNVKNKTVEELAELRSRKLNLLYIGCESGDDDVLAFIDKGETFVSSLSALTKTSAAGMERSVMILNGLGGTRLSEQHAMNSARLVNEAQPEYLATLVLTYDHGIEHFRQRCKGSYEPLDQRGLFEEMELMMQQFELEKTVFRSDHASNYLILKGVLNQDKEQLLQTLHTAIHQPGRIPLRPEWARGF